MNYQGPELFPLLNLRPPPKLTVSQWADTKRMLSSESSADPGQWVTANAEFQRGIMDAVSDPLNEDVVVVASSQVGKTELELNIIGYHIDQDPCPALMVMSQLDLAESLSKDRFDPMIRDSPCFWGKVSDVKQQKNKQTTILHKRYPGGLLVFSGANSPSSLASRPVRKVLFDEVDRYPSSIGNKEKREGDPVAIGKKRAITFRHRKQYIYVSSPGVLAVSRIMRLFNQSDQRHYMVACPRCKTFQKLIFSDRSYFSSVAGGRIVFDEANLSWVYYECERCKEKIAESHKSRMVATGQWESTRPEIVGHAGFHISELYSPWSSWRQIVEDFLVAKKNKDELQVFVNTTLGEPWDQDEGYTVNENMLMSRREEYTKIPSGVLVLTAGADTQDDRLEVSLWGWGLNDESWLISHRAIYGEPTDLTVFQALDDVLLNRYQGEDGIERRVECACIDMLGHFAKQVKEYVRRCAPRRVFATYGKAGIGRGIIGKRSRHNPARARMLPGGVDAAQTTIFRRLVVEPPKESGAPSSYGRVHFPMTADENYFQMLLAERAVVKRRQGGYYRTFEKKSPSARNESLDCLVGAMAALEVLNPNWSAYKKRYDKLVAEAGVKKPEPDKIAVHSGGTNGRGGIRVIGRFE